MNSLVRLSYFAHPTAVIDEGAQVGEGSQIWHFCHLMPKAKIGAHCKLGQNVFIADHVQLGDNVKVQNNVSIYTGVICEDDVFVGPSAVFTNVLNPRSAVNRQDQYQITTIKKGATIGANATIVCGTSIGQYAFVGAGTVVTRDIPDFALAVGNPARQIGWMSAYGERLSFDEKGIAVCATTKDRYRLADSQVVRIKLLETKNEVNVFP